MIADILMALVCSLMFQFFGLIGKTMKQVLIAVCCTTLIIAYFYNGNTFNFIGTMDFATWVLFVAVFNNIMFTLLEQWFVRIFKDLNNK